MKIKKLKKKWKVGMKNNILISEKCSIQLNNNEQINFSSKNFKNIENEICKKNWGYYLTPSINKRLIKYKHKVFILKNLKKSFYLAIVKNSNITEFKKYCKNENLKFFSFTKLL
tara:strand:+ start:754 stop:1095 length:342 start_codon:yes stop_codon:yes gene_type:complete